MTGTRFGALVAATLLVPAGAALAVDGVIEINQDCASVGCLTGDGPGFPVTIGQAGSYRLTGDLSVASGVGISIGADEVTLDLNGFAIRCTGSCPSGISGGGADDSWVRNGVVSGFGGIGVSLGLRGRVWDMRVHGNGGIGIGTNSFARVWRNEVFQNAGGGISVLHVSDVTGNTVHDNPVLGIRIAARSRVAENVVYQNGEGIFTDGGPVGFGNVIVDNTVNANASGGIRTGEGSTVARNAVYANQGDGIDAGLGSTINDNTVRANTLSGIEADGGSVITGNAVNANTRCGLFLGGGAGYRGNVMVGNASNSRQVFGGLDLGNNLCGSDTNCANDGTSNCP